MTFTEDQVSAILDRYNDLLDEELSEEETLAKVEELFTSEEQKVISDIFMSLPQPAQKDAATN
jgi:hypothetical protein